MRLGYSRADAASHVEEGLTLKQLLAAAVDSLLLDDAVSHLCYAVGGGLAHKLAHLVVHAPVAVAEVLIVIVVEVGAGVVVGVGLDADKRSVLILALHTGLVVDRAVPCFGYALFGEHSLDVVVGQQVVGLVERQSALALGEAVLYLPAARDVVLLPPYKVPQTFLYVGNSNHGV